MNAENLTKFNLDEFLSSGFFLINFNLNTVFFGTDYSFDNKKKQGFSNIDSSVYSNNFFLSMERKWLNNTIQQASCADFFSFFEAIKKNKIMLDFKIFNQDFYKDYFKRIKNKIESGEINKAVCFSSAESFADLKKENIVYLIKCLSGYINSKNHIRTNL